MVAAALACDRKGALGVAIPYSPLADVFGFTALPAAFLGALALMIGTYLGLVEVGKYVFFKRMRPGERPLALARPDERRVHRVASAWTHAASLAHSAAGRARWPTTPNQPSGRAGAAPR